jgi:hypothetical protein
MKSLKIIILFFLLFSGMRLNATTYYLKSASASAARTPSSWNTAADGSGTNLGSWTNSGTNDTYIVPLGVDGVWSFIDTIGNSGSGAQSYTFIINGSLEIDNNDKIVFNGSANIVTFTVNGTLIIDENNGSTFETSDIDYAQFIFSSFSTLISNNRIGIFGTGFSNCVFEDDAEFRLYFANNVNYEFYNPNANTSLRGLQDTVNNLTINTVGRTSTLQDNILVNGTLTITNGSIFAVATRTLTIGTSGTFNHSTGSITFSTGIFNINGTYTHSSGTFTMTGAASVNVGSTGTLHLNTGVLDMLGRTLTVAGNITRSSGYLHFSAGLGQITFTNTVAKTLPANLFLRYPANFRLNGAGITLSGKSGVLKDSIGAVVFTSGNLTITTDTTCISSITGTGGRIIGNTSATIIFYGTVSFNLRFDQGTPGVTNAIKNVILRGTSQVNLSARLRIAPGGVLELGTGTTFTTNGNLAIVSNASGNGRIGTVLGGFTSSSGDSLQLYIPGGTRGFRLFGNPFTSALAISQFMNSSTEIDITGTGGSGNGFTNTTSNRSSAFSYNTANNTWDAFSSTSGTIAVGGGAHILVRGIKGQGLTSGTYTPSAATIRLAGQFRSGNVITSLSDAGFGWNLVGNPYASNIDIDQISSGNWNNVNAAIYGYDKVNRTYSAYTKGSPGSSVNNLSNIIEMGSSFLAEVTGAGSASITFTEAIKTSASSTVSGNPIFAPKEERFNQFRINLSGEVGTEGFFQDECLLSFGNTNISTPEFDPQSDAWDLGAELLNVGIVTPNNNYLAINEYPSIEKQTDAIPLNIWSKNIGEYSLSLTEVAAISENTEIWLRDKYKNVVHFIQESPYKFDINDIEESLGANRFELFTVQRSSGLSKTSTKNTLRVFPNPVDMNTGKVSVYIPGEGHEYVKTTIYDLSGKEVYSSKKVKYETMQTIDISLPIELSKQAYIMSCETLQGTFIQQIIINNK